MSYKAQYLPDHPRADFSGYVAEHILIAEKLNGGPLEKGIVVHHKDWNKLNNPTDGSNYKLLTRPQHQQLPYMQGRYLAEKGLLEDFWSWWKEREQLYTLLYQKELLVEKMLRQQERMKRRLNAKNAL